MAVVAVAAAAAAECSICFEELSSVGGAVPLPCDCRVDYCSGCWDRALATSQAIQGAACCPTCRTPMRVEYDISLRKMRFLRASEAAPPASPGAASSSSSSSSPGPPEDEVADEDWTRQVYKQARPRQLELLRLYSAADPKARDDPWCCCGSHLRFVTLDERVVQMVRELPIMPEGLLEFLRAMREKPPITCDVCEQNVPSTDEGVWSCENGQRTMLHTAAYDVCMACFSKHTRPCRPFASDDDDDDDTSTVCAKRHRTGSA